jgi:hypothetical protein
MNVSKASRSWWVGGAFGASPKRVDPSCVSEIEDVTHGSHFVQVTLGLAAGLAKTT